MATTNGLQLISDQQRESGVLPLLKEKFVTASGTYYVFTHIGGRIYFKFSPKAVR